MCFTNESGFTHWVWIMLIASYKRLANFFRQKFHFWSSVRGRSLWIIKTDQFEIREICFFAIHFEVSANYLFGRHLTISEGERGFCGWSWFPHLSMCTWIDSCLSTLHAPACHYHYDLRQSDSILFAFHTPATSTFRSGWATVIWFIIKNKSSIITARFRLIFSARLYSYRSRNIQPVQHFCLSYPFSKANVQLPLSLRHRQPNVEKEK